MKKCLLIGGESHGRIINIPDDKQPYMKILKPYKTDRSKPTLAKSFEDDAELYELTVTSPTHCIYSRYGTSQNDTVTKLVQLVEALQAAK